MGKTMVYIGSYSSDSGEGIYTFELDNTTGKLNTAFAPVHADNPSYLTLSDDQRYLYAVLETREFHGVFGGGAAAYKINNKGGLTFLNESPTMGLDPCYLSTDRSNSILVASNYSSGSLSVFSLEQQGAIEPCLLVETHMGSGPDQERQEMPHVHFTDFTPDGKYICAVDLGIDTVKFYRFDKKANTLHTEDRLNILLRPGTGPRHVVFHEGMRFVYIITELSSEIAVFEYVDGRYEARQYISTLPPDFKGSSAAAALRMSPDGRFLYASNRGHDSIASFQIGKDGVLVPCGIYPVQGQGPRDFAIEPLGNYLLAANEKSNEIVILKVDKASGALKPTGISEKLHSPTCIQFLPINGVD